MTGFSGLRWLPAWRCSPLAAVIDLAAGVRRPGSRRCRT